MSDSLDVLYEGRYLSLVTREGWEFALRHRARAVVILLAITDDDAVVLVEQYRQPLGRPVIELPAGLVGDIAGREDETLEVAGRRELLEETGYEPESLTLLMEGPTSAGLTSETVSMFLASGLRRVGPGGGDDNEDITVHEVALGDVPGWLREQEGRGAMVDPKVYAGLHFAARRAQGGGAARRAQGGGGPS